MRKNLLTILLLLAIVATITVLIFKPVLQHPNSYLFSKGGDAVKSYYNFSYHLKYGEGIKHKGINYPYGEHLQYINSHPFHTAILKQVNKVVSIDKYGVAILNISMIFSMLLAIPFLFLILRKFKLPPWYAAIAALIILFLSPQLDRIKGHFEMVYLFFIPVYWYLFMLFRENKKPWLWGTILVITGLIGGFTSAYFVAFYAILILSVLFAEIWEKRKNLSAYWKNGLVLLMMAALPLLLVKGLVSVTDWAPQRPYNPWGFYVFHANPFSVFLPDHSLIRKLLDGLISMNYQWEGRSFVGRPAAWIALTILATIIYQFIKKKQVPFLFENKHLNTYLLGATLVLLFSMCFPFKWGFGFLLEVLPPVKQFRALGRFAWIFYYVFTVYSAYLIYQFYLNLKTKNYRIFSNAFLFFMLGSWSIDAAYTAKKSFSGIFLQNDKLEASDMPYQHMLQEAQIDPAKYQAIFFLPFANTSGDKLFFEEGLKNAFAEAMKCSYHTGIPLIQSFSPRLPFPHALSTTQLLADSTLRKTRMDDMTDQSILLVITEDHLTDKEKWMIENARILHQYDGVTLAEFDPATWEKSHNNWLTYAHTVSKSLMGNLTLKADTTLSSIVYQSFDEYESDQVFHGKGALFQRRNTLQVFNKDFASEGMVGAYELCFWMHFDTRAYDMPQPKIHIHDTEGEWQKTIRLNNRQIHNIYTDWVLVEQQLILESGKVYKLEINGKYITIDDLLLKPTGSNVWIEAEKGKELFNNFPLY